MTAAATETADTNYWLPIGLALALWMAAIAVGQLWQLADRGDGRGDMFEGDPTAQTIKWNPGHYTKLQYNGTSDLAQINSVIDEAGNSSTLRGLRIQLAWKFMESDATPPTSTTPGDYSNGFALVDDWLTRAENQTFPVRLMFEFPKSAYFGSRNCSALFPSYLCDGGHVAIAPTGSTLPGGLTMIDKLWLDYSADRAIELVKAYGNRYAAHPLIEAVLTGGETSIAQNVDPSFDCNSLGAKLRERWTIAREYWPGTLIHISANFSCAPNLMRDINVEYVGSGDGFIAGGPDPANNLSDTNMSTWQRCFRGEESGCIDLRGRGPYFAEVQRQTFCEGGKGEEFPPNKVWDWYTSRFSNSVSHMVWLYNDWCNSRDWRDGFNEALNQRWNTPGGPKAWIESIGGVPDLTNCPLAFVNRGISCVTGGT